MKNHLDHKKYNLKRQWGAEKRLHPLSNFHDVPSTFKVAFSRIAIVLTVIFWGMYILSVIIRQFLEGPKGYDFTMEAFGYAFVVSVLVFSALMYLIMRQGAFQRFSKHIRVSRAFLDKHFFHNRPSITVLVPSYAEEPQVVRKTLFSAALQEYPNIRIVLLVDDNPKSTNAQDVARLEATHKMVSEIENLLKEPFAHTARALSKFEKKKTGKYVTGSAITELASTYSWAAKWLNTQADKEKIEDHVDVFFTEQVLRELANDLTLVSEALNTSSKENAHISRERVHQLYRRLTWIFGAKLTVFQRKLYASLSHEANKAMNLNAYIGLMGGTYRQEQTPDGVILIPTDKKAKNTLTIPDSEFLLTLDADSILLREYCLRLVYFLQQPDNAKVAVTQTPYSSFRGASSRIERLAAATTDIQHILHQGMTQYGATFWVGANAVIRKDAIEDIVEKEWVGGFEIKRYVQDRTVIEDTESSVDLALHGWSLINYPERLSYSATPPDFGSLIVQRRRWANGGLLILPKLIAYIQAGRHNKKPVSMVEVMVRINYMASIAWASFGLLFLLAYPYDGRLLSPLVLLAALPYFIAMAVDLKYNGYNYSDIFRIYGFNLILLPVNLAGVLKSLQQAFTAKKIPFARTPKVKNRTVAPLPYIIAPILIVAFSLFTVWRNVEGQNWGNAAFAGFNAFAATWAIVSYIGVVNLFVDLWLGLTNWLYVDLKPVKSKKAVVVASLDWKSVLYHGETHNDNRKSFGHIIEGSIYTEGARA